MDAPLGTSIGNALEVVEAIEVLKGRGPGDTRELSVLLAARMLVAAGVSPDEASAAACVNGAIASGAGLEAFRSIIENQGGDPKVLDDYARLPRASREHRVVAARGGFVTFRAEPIGRAAVALGAGRLALDEVVNPAVGIELLVPHGAAVNVGDPVLRVRYDDEAKLAMAIALLDGAVGMSDEAPPVRPLVVERIVNG
jgi:thymidine phosphorylase